MAGESSGQGSMQCNTVALVVIELGHITLYLAGVPTFPTKTRKMTPGTRELGLLSEGEWLLWWLMKRGGSHSINKLDRGHDVPDMQGEMFCAHKEVCPTSLTAALHLGCTHQFTCWEISRGISMHLEMQKCLAIVCS